MRGLGHAAFRRESLLNTPLFAGFPGFVSKLWLADDDLGRYRGLYEWDDPLLAENYARTLWRVLALVSVPGSIHYVVLPGLRRDEVLERPRLLDDATIMASVARTHRAVIVDEGWRSGSLAAEVSARITEQAFYDLDAPAARVCSAEVPMPYPRHLEEAALPQPDRIVAAAREVVG